MEKTSGREMKKKMKYNDNKFLRRGALLIKLFFYFLRARWKPPFFFSRKKGIFIGLNEITNANKTNVQVKSGRKIMQSNLVRFSNFGSLKLIRHTRAVSVIHTIKFINNTVHLNVQLLLHLPVWRLLMAWCSNSLGFLGC